MQCAILQLSVINVDGVISAIVKSAGIDPTVPNIKEFVLQTSNPLFQVQRHVIVTVA